MAVLPDELEVITLFVGDVAAAREFYTGVFGGEVIFEDRVSFVMRLKNVLINILQDAESATLVEPMAAGDDRTPVRVLLTVRVDDADTTCRELERRGIALLNGPIDRSWGRRTAAFADPARHIWEIAQEL